MKKTLAPIVIIFCFLNVALAQHDQFALSGTVTNFTTGKVYLQKYNNKMLNVIDSAVVENGKFTFHTKPKLPELYGISLDPTVDLLYPFYIFLENAPITVVVDSTGNYANSPESYAKSSVKGSSQQDLFTAYKKNAKNFKIDSFIQAHPASLVPAYVLYRNYSFRLSPEEIEHNVALFDKSIEQSQYVKLLKSLPETLRKAGIGKKAIDFQQWDTEGKPYRLYDHFGKYLFIDFWAAWCPPCRAESPALIKLYAKYNKAGLDFLGISFDKEKEPWIKAIAHDKLPWKQVADFKFWDNKVGQLYGIRLIPANILIDPKGVIIGRNLHGEELEHKLEDIFKF